MSLNRECIGSTETPMERRAERQEEPSENDW